MQRIFDLCLYIFLTLYFSLGAVLKFRVFFVWDVKAVDTVFLSPMPVNFRLLILPLYLLLTFTWWNVFFLGENLAKNLSSSAVAP